MTMRTKGVPWRALGSDFALGEPAMERSVGWMELFILGNAVSGEPRGENHQRASELEAGQRDGFKKAAADARDLRDAYLRVLSSISRLNSRSTRS